MKKSNFIIVVLILIFGFFLLKKCEKEPKVITKTEIEYVKVTDTITKVEIKEVPKTVYINKIKTIKGKDSIVYVPTPNDNTITANQYDTKIESNNATADLKITTTGELLDVSGVINYTQENKTTTITKTKPQSGLFLYTETSVNPMFERAELGLDCQISNKVIIGTSVSYNNIVKKPYFNVKLGFKIF
jgi:hypothetical protein